MKLRLHGLGNSPPWNPWRRSRNPRCEIDDFDGRIVRDRTREFISPLLREEAGRCKCERTQKYSRREINARPILDAGLRECPINVNVSAAGKLALPFAERWNIYFAPGRQSGHLPRGHLSISPEFLATSISQGADLLSSWSTRRSNAPVCDEFRISNPTIAPRGFFRDRTESQGTSRRRLVVIDAFSDRSAISGFIRCIKRRLLRAVRERESLLETN